MLRVSFQQRFPAHVVWCAGEPADPHVVVDGQVEVFAGYRDRETTIPFPVPYSLSSPPSCSTWSI
jgi:hypothetical protein